MDQILARIAAWEAAGLIDAATASRLRMVETARLPAAPAVATGPSPEPGVGPPDGAHVPRSTSPAGAILGPAVSIVEMFGYLGGAFLLGAYAAFAERFASGTGDADLWRAAAAAVAALAITVVALRLRLGDPRRRRAAGVFLAVAVGCVAVAGFAIGNRAGLSFQLVAALASGAASLAAIAARRIQPALVTQATLLAALTGFAGALLGWLESVAAPQRFTDFGEPILEGRPEPLFLVLAAAAWWLGVAIVFGLLALGESRNARRDEAAGRRAALTRLWAGLTAVLGLSSAVFRSDFVAPNDFGRVLEPWMGDVALLLLAAVLVERAFRRDASAYVYAAALAVMIALSDFNFTYLSSSTEVGLLVEGLILLGAGFAADRIRRRVGQPADDRPDSDADRSSAPPVRT
ncbi:MAG TPA: hypothetical protein VFO78_02530 [Candidatus Limnocylindrales bacterium]|nr:hypothetical protein [Candidatus Limnocylindrales bacterium]